MLSCGVDTSTGTTLGPYQDGGGAISPARFSCRIFGGGNQANPCNSCNSSNWYKNPAITYADPIGVPSVQTGVWYDMVWKINWSCTTGGEMNWWVNGKQVANYSGPTCCI